MTPRDHHHFQAAQGWLELGNWLEANEELEQMTPEQRGHPDALRLRIEIYSAAKNWDCAAEIANALSRLVPDDPFGHIRLAFALHELKRTREAYDTLLPVADKFSEQWVITYNLACYCAQLERLGECQQWFKKAMAIDEERCLERFWQLRLPW